MPGVTVSRALGSIAGLERATGDMYAFYASIFCDHPLAAPIFKKIQSEEMEHHTEVLFQKRLVDSSPGMFGDLDISLTEIHRIIQTIDRHLTKASIDLLDAVDFAIHIEEQAMEAHYRTWVLKHSPALTKVAGFLKKGDEHHVDQLKQLKMALR